MNRDFIGGIFVGFTAGAVAITAIYLHLAGPATAQTVRRQLPPWHASCFTNPMTKVTGCRVAGDVMVEITDVPPGFPAGEKMRMGVLTVSGLTKPWTASVEPQVREIAVSIDGNPQVRFTCALMQGCTTTAEEGERLTAQAMHGKSITVTMETAQREMIDHTMPMAGFTEAVAEVAQKGFPLSN